MQTLHDTPTALRDTPTARPGEQRSEYERRLFWALGPDPVAPRRSLVGPLVRSVTLQSAALIVLLLDLLSGQWLLLLPNLLVGIAMVSVLDVFNAFRPIRGLAAVNCVLAVVVAQIGIPVLVLQFA